MGWIAVVAGVEVEIKIFEFLPQNAREFAHDTVDVRVNDAVREVKFPKFHEGVGFFMDLKALEVQAVGFIARARTSSRLPGLSQEGSGFFRRKPRRMTGRELAEAGTMSEKSEPFWYGLYSRSWHFLESLSEQPGFPWKLSLGCMLLVAFFSSPDYPVLGADATWAVVSLQIQDPLQNVGGLEPTSHEAKRTFRLFVPVLAKALGLNSPFSIYAMQQILTFLGFYWFYRLARKVLDCKALASVLTLTLCFVNFGQTGVVDIFAKFDVFAYTFLIGAMWIQSPWLVFLLCLSASFTDERGLAALPIVIIWHALFEPETRRLGFERLKTRRAMLAFAPALAMLAYVILRIHLKSQYGFSIPFGDVGVAVILRQINMLYFGTWTMFEGLWLLPVVGSIVLIRQRRWALLTLLTSMLTGYVAISFIVIDITRSLCFFFPLLFFYLVVLNRESRRFQQGVIMASLAVSALVPTYQAYGAFRIEGTNLLPLRFVDYLVGKL